MKKIKKILVPTDFSDNAATAYNVAQKFAGQFGARVDFIHVIQTLSHYNKGIAKLNVPIKTDEDLYPQLKKQASHRVKNLMDDYIKSENKGDDIVLIANEPYSAIPKHAKEGEYDLIVMATLGAHDSNFLIGSVAEKVIRYSDVPVLATGISNLDEIQNILVPTDGSLVSFKALLLAIPLAIAFNAGITLFYVRESAKPRSDDVNFDETNGINLRSALHAELKDFLARSSHNVELQGGDQTDSQLVCQEDISSASVAMRTVIEYGVSAHKLISEYAEQHADLVVMTTHGRTGLAHMFIGSTAENVVRQIQLPVITVKPDVTHVG